MRLAHSLGDELWIDKRAPLSNSGRVSTRPTFALFSIALAASRMAPRKAAVRGALGHYDGDQFFKDLATPFYGANRPGSKVSQGIRDSFWLQAMIASFNACSDCIKAFSETDQT